MVNTDQLPDGLLPLTPAVFNILLALADGEKHGYAIMLEVDQNTQGEVKMGPGTLYGSIKRMLAAGLIEECDERPDPELDDQRRRYYQLSGLGRQALTAEAERLSRQVTAARLKQKEQEELEKRAAATKPVSAGRRRESATDAFIKSVARAAGSSVGRKLFRGILGSLLK